MAVSPKMYRLLLEEELGAPLFERHSLEVTSTAAGHRLLPYAFRMQHLLDDARRSFHDDGVPQGLIVGALETTAALRLSPYLSSYVASYPRVDLVLRPGTTCELIKDVLGDDALRAMRKSYRNWPRALRLHPTSPGAYRRALVCSVPSCLSRCRESSRLSRRGTSCSNYCSPDIRRHDLASYDARGDCGLFCLRHSALVSLVLSMALCIGTLRRCSHGARCSNGAAPCPAVSPRGCRRLHLRWDRMWHCHLRHSCAGPLAMESRSDLVWTWDIRFAPERHRLERMASRKSSPTARTGKKPSTQVATKQGLGTSRIRSSLICCSRRSLPTSARCFPHADRSALRLHQMSCERMFISDVRVR
jgi:DNA-binding transcriptional LysR family regulator